MDRLPVVHRQLISLSVDTAQERLSGFTELQVSWPNLESKIGLHAYKLDLHKVLVDGQEAGFDVRHYPATGIPPALLKGHFSSAKDAAAKVAEYSMHEYERLLQREEEPELTITLPKTFGMGDVTDPMRDATLRIEYSTQASTSGMHFCGDCAFTDNEVRRARAWFPCVDTPASACPFELRISVPEGYTAVGPGELHKQTQTLDRRKTFHYRVPLDTPPCHIAIAVGPFAILPGCQLPGVGGITEGLKGEGDESAAPPSPDRANAAQGEAVITHFGPPWDLPELKFSSQFVPLAFNTFESLLGAKFPYKAFQQAILPSELGPLRPIAAAGLQIVSSDVLYTERCIEQAVEARLAVARSIAQQWFGVFLRPKAPADAWLLEGLTGWLEDQYVRLYMGRNEQAFRRFKEREAIYLADTGQAPPLYPRGESYPWGPMHGTEALDPSELRRWKATAVIGMLEKRVGEEAFKKLLERIVFAACDTSAKDVTKRLLGTRDFLKEVGKQGGFRKDITAFHERWIAGQGCVQLTAAFTFHKKRSVLELAVRQSGNKAARKSAERAAAAASKDASSIGIVEVQVRQDKVNPASSSEHPVNIGLNPVSLVEIKLASRQAVKKLRKKKRGAAAADEDDSGDDDGPDDQDAANRPPLSWVRIDPQAEMLASTRVLQPVSMWAAQLEHSRDVAAQSAAVAGLLNFEPFTYSALNALQACLENSKVYCRVRVEAAMAMGLTAHKLENLPAVDKLIKFYADRCFDENTHLPRPHQFDNLAEHLVNQAVPLALGVVRDENGFTPVEAVDFILELLEYNDNSNNLWSDGSFLAALFDACGLLRVQNAQALLALLTQIERYIARDAVLPSHQHVVSQAALGALASLAGEPAHHHHLADRAQRLLQQKATLGAPYHVRLAAVKAGSRLAAAQGGLDAAREATLQFVKQESLLRVRYALLEDFWQLLRESRPCKDPPLGKPLPATLAVLEQLHSLLGAGHDCPSSRHLAFMILQRLGGLPSSLFKEPKEEEVAGPTMSMETGAPRRVKPAASQATSMSGGRQTMGIKVRIKGAASMAPGASVGPRAQPTMSVSQLQHSLGTPQPPSPTSRRKSQLFGVASRGPSPSPVPASLVEAADSKPASLQPASFEMNPQGNANISAGLPSATTVLGARPPVPKIAPTAAAATSAEDVPASKRIKLEPGAPDGNPVLAASGTDGKAERRKEKKKSKDREHKRKKLEAGAAAVEPHVPTQAVGVPPMSGVSLQQPLGIAPPETNPAGSTAAILEDVQRIMLGPSSKDSAGAAKVAAKAKAKRTPTPQPSRNATPQPSRTVTPQPARDPTPPREVIEAAVRDAVAIASGAFRQATPPPVPGETPLAQQPGAKPPKARKEKKSRAAAAAATQIASAAGESQGAAAPAKAGAAAKESRPAVWKSRGQVAAGAAAGNRVSPQPGQPSAAETLNAKPAHLAQQKPLNIKLSLGGRSGQPGSLASQQPVKSEQQPVQPAVEEEPLTFFGKQATAAASRAESAPRDKSSSPARKKAPSMASSAGPAAPHADSGAPARKMSIKPPRPKATGERPKGAGNLDMQQKPNQTAAAKQLEQAPAPKAASLKLKIRLGGKPVGSTDASKPAGSSASEYPVPGQPVPGQPVTGKHVLDRPPPASRPSPSPTPQPAPKAASQSAPKPPQQDPASTATVDASSKQPGAVAASSAQPGRNETAEQRAERKRLEKLAKEARRKDETEEEKAARRAAKKDKKDAKKAKRNSHEASLGT